MQMKRPSSIKGLILSTIALCSLLLSGNAAYAALVTYSFQGAVGEVTGVLFPTLNTGHTMTGDITFESGALPTVSFPGTSMYLHSIAGANLHIGSFNAVWKPGANGIILTNGAPGTVDNITAFTSMDGGEIKGTKPTMFDVSLTDPSGNAFGSVNLPTAPPSLSSFASNKWRLTFGNGNVVLGSLTKLTAVPLPAAVILFGAGLISLVGLGAGGLRNLRRPQA